MTQHIRVSQENKTFDLKVPALITFVPRSKKVKKEFWGFFRVRPDTPPPPARRSLPLYEKINFHVHTSATHHFDRLVEWSNGV